MSWRTVRVVCFGVVMAAAAAQACGGDSTDGGPGAAGSAGASGAPATAGAAGKAQATKLECGTKTCAGVLIPVSGQSFELAPCCADEKTSQCGIDSTVLGMFGPTFPEACQPVAQPGVPDDACPQSPSQAIQGSPLTIKFDGCCRPNHTCGYQLDSIGGLIPLGLGCVDSAPFVDGGAPLGCGVTSGEGGASGEGNTAGNGGAPAAGAAGEFAAGAAGI